LLQEASVSGDHYKLSEVFGISRDVPLNYTPRPDVDDVLVDSLTREKHIVLYGSSKQGKTCLRKYNLKEAEYIVVTCANRWNLGHLHAQILKEAGYTIEASATQTVTGESKISAKFAFKAKIPGVAELETGLGAEDGEGGQSTLTYRSLELDPFDPNDIIRALNEIEFDSFIVLEDFHYLPEETQVDFAVAMKAFHEHSRYSFIVVGVWLDPNRLIQHNGDLRGRVLTVDVDGWDEEHLHQVITSGEKLLRISFDPELRKDLVAGCFDSVSIVQEACHEACEMARIFATQAEYVENVGHGVDASDLIKRIVDEQSASYHSFLVNFADGFVTTELEMYRWLLYPILSASVDGLEQGLSYSHINNVLKGVHPRGEDLNPGNVTQALKSTASLQVGKMNIKPIILDYDQSSRRLGVVDRGFLVWLQYQDKNLLLDELGLPTSTSSN
jgi:hypothetical protein